MQSPRPHQILLIALCSLIGPALLGCEGIDRKHDVRVGVDINPPPIDADPSEEKLEVPSYPDLVETMMASRRSFIEDLLALERGYMLGGDMVRANWARRQRELTENVEIYPYLTEEAPGQSVAVEPVDSIPEADELYDSGIALYKTFVGIPFRGFTKLNHEDCRKALQTFKRVIAGYPRSDKVDDCAYYCGVIYKEFLREDDPDNELAIRYFMWAVVLNPETPYPARFEAAVVYEYRLHNPAKAIELYHAVLETEEAGDRSNMRWAANRIDALTDDDHSPIRPREPRASVPRTAATARLPESAEPGGE